MTDNKGTILVVDDTSMNLKLLSEMLTKQGYRVRAARDGRMALMSVQANVPDLILLDIKMQKMDGYEVCRHLKADEHTRDVPVIFISALNDTEDIVKGFEVGGVDYVTKPFQFREVLARVENQLTLAQQRRQIEETRERDLQYYETLSKMRDQFVRAATHDLKNPLALITGYVGLLESHQAAEQYPDLKSYVQGIRQGTQKMLNLVTDMLELAQMESGLVLSPAPVNMNAFLQPIVEDYVLQANQAGIALSFHPAADDTTIMIDQLRMERAVDNLVSNALKYTPAGGEVAVSACDEVDHFVIQVADTGYGIPEDALPHLFDAFYRVRKKEHMEIDGTGLGLSIVKTIVEQHGGQIQVETQLGEGSAFTIILPKS